MKKNKKNLAPIVVGTFYEDCRFHPMICIGVNYRRDTMVGVSLIDGKVGFCSPTHCGVRTLSPAEALRNRIYGLPPALLKSVMNPSAMHRSWMKQVKAEQERLRKAGIFFPNPDETAIDLVEGITKALRRKSK